MRPGDKEWQKKRDAFVYAVAGQSGFTVTRGRVEALKLSVVGQPAALQQEQEESRKNFKKQYSQKSSELQAEYEKLDKELQDPDLADQDQERDKIFEKADTLMKLIRDARGEQAQALNNFLEKQREALEAVTKSSREIFDMLQMIEQSMPKDEIPKDVQTMKAVPLNNQANRNKIQEAAKSVFKEKTTPISSIVAAGTKEPVVAPPPNQTPNHRPKT